MPFGSPIQLQFRIVVDRAVNDLEFGIALCNAAGTEIASPISSDAVKLPRIEAGEYALDFQLEDLTLCTGLYILDLGIRSDRGMEDHIKEALEIEVEPTIRSSEMRLHLRRGSVIPGVRFAIAKG